jgi:hypothetical protein
MNSDQENFEALRKLLALKKYEQPPPRYFSELPSRIWVRIERERQTTSFWARLFPNFGLNPAMAYSFGLLACGTLVFGIGYSLRTETAQTANNPLANDNPLAASRGLAARNVSELNLFQCRSRRRIMCRGNNQSSFWNTKFIPSRGKISFPFSIVAVAGAPPSSTS